MRLGIDGMPGPTVPFARDAPLRLGLDGFYGEQKAKEVLHDGSIRTKRVTISLRTDAPVPSHAGAIPLRLQAGRDQAPPLSPDRAKSSRSRSGSTHAWPS